MTPPGYEWRGVLAGAYANDKAMARMVDHIVNVDTGTVLCRRVKPERMSDIGSYGTIPHCSECERRADRLSSPSAATPSRSKARRAHPKRTNGTTRSRGMARARLHRTRALLRRRRKRIQSKNARSDTPLAREYRQAKAAYRKAGRALRSSCSARSRECGFPARTKMKGRQRFKFVADSVGSMKSTFLGAPSDTGTNEDAIRHSIGHMNVKDATQWEPVSEKYEKKNVETFDQAFAVLAKESKKDWRKFDIQALRECRGMESVELPPFMHEAKSQEEIEESFNVPF